MTEDALKQPTTAMVGNYRGGGITKPETEREAFEKWLSSVDWLRSLSLASFHPYDNPDIPVEYYDDRTRIAWASWQAALEHRKGGK